MASARMTVSDSQTHDVFWKRPNRFSIHVYKCGDEYDPGMKIAVTRMHMPHWISLLDYLTHRLNLVDGSVQQIYTLDGMEIRHFRQLKNNERYVAAHGKFKRRNYGGLHAKKPPFGVQTAIYEDNNDAGRLGFYSDEGLKNYLQQHDFQPTLGDVWDNTQFDLRNKRGILNQENTTTLPMINSGNFHHHYRGRQNGSYRSLGVTDHSRLAQTENLAATMLTRINRSRSEGPPRRLSPTWNVMESPKRGGIQSGINGNQKGGAAIVKSKSERDIGENKKERSFIPKIEGRIRNAGRTPATSRRTKQSTNGQSVQHTSYDTNSQGDRNSSSVKGKRLIQNGNSSGSRTSGQRKDGNEAEAAADERNEGTGGLVSEDEEGRHMLAGELSNGNNTINSEVDNEDHSPRWATELTEAVRELASEVHHLHPPLTTETVRNFQSANHKSQ